MMTALSNKYQSTNPTTTSLDVYKKSSSKNSQQETTEVTDHENKGFEYPMKSAGESKLKFKHPQLLILYNRDLRELVTRELLT